MNTSRTFAPTVLISLLVTCCFCAPAFADSLTVKQAEANHVQQQIGALNTKAEIASENYNRARVRYDNVTVRVHITQSRVSKLKKHQRFLQGHLDTRVVDMYRNGPLGFLPVLFSVRTFEEFTTTIRVLTTLNNQDAATVAQLKQTKAAAENAEQVLVAAQDEARQQKLAMASNAAAVKAQLDARQKLLASLDAEIRVLVIREIVAQSAAQQARTMAVLIRQRSASSGGILLGGTAPNSKAAAAVYWAEKEIGKPYVWAAAGPDSFDCSGLMLWAYDHVGIHLNHYSGDQIHEGAPVSRSNLQPGDLVFFGSPIHHVGMYCGGGNFIEAPYTGTTVQIAPLGDRSDFAGACRPSS